MDEAKAQNQRSSDQAIIQGSPLLFTWRSRFLEAKAQVILWFVSYISRRRGREKFKSRRKKDRLEQAFLLPLYCWLRRAQGTYCLVLHSGEYDIQHLGESGLCSGLVDEVFAGQIDVVACPHSLKHGALMDLDVLGCYCSEQGLTKERESVQLGQFNKLQYNASHYTQSQFNSVSITRSTSMVTTKALNPYPTRRELGDWEMYFQNEEIFSITQSMLFRNQHRFHTKDWVYNNYNNLHTQEWQGSSKKKSLPCALVSILLNYYLLDNKDKGLN